MIGPRLAGIPNDHVIAELAAFPFSSEESFALALTSLDHDLNENTAKLWRKAEDAMLRSFPGFSVDEAVAIRDQLWFDHPSAAPQPMHRYLQRTAQLFLERRGARAVPVPRRGFWNSDMEPARHSAVSRRAWRWISFALPQDLLLAALGTPDSIPTVVDSISPRLANHLRDQGFAEVHLHGAAGLSFSLLWSGAVAQIADPETRADSFQSPGACFRGGKDLGPWLLRAAIGRYTLAAFLTYQRYTGSFLEFFRDILPLALNQSSPHWILLFLKSCLDELLGARLTGLDHASLQTMYRQITRLPLRRWILARKSEKDGLSDPYLLHSIDPLSEFFPMQGSLSPTPEMRFLATAMEYLKRREERRESDRVFEIIFWQVVRIRALFYRHVVQRPMIPGLQWFLRHYERMRDARRPLRIGRFAAAAHAAGWKQGLRSLEFRTAPEDSLTKNLRDVDHWVRDSHILAPQQTESTQSPTHQLEFGIVFHISRSRGQKSTKGVPPSLERGSNADPSTSENSNNTTGYRFAHYYKRERQKAIALASMLERFPASLLVVRALDACTDELGVPTWVIAPLFRYIRCVADAASARLAEMFGWSVPSLRMTAHAGEDFPHLLTGLRATDEAIRRFEIRPGDRIGHAIALGLDPHDWAQKAGLVPVRREVRLFDLVWEWSWASREGALITSGRSRQVEHEITRLSELIFGRPYPPYDLQRLMNNLHDERMLKAVGFCDGLVYPSALSDESPEGLLLRYLTSRDTFLRGQIVEWVDPNSERSVLEEIQSSIRRRLGEAGIAVEVNPSSNLLIGDFTDLTRHPLWRLYPPRPIPDTPPVSICIGSDDPLTFATSLPEEYQFVFDSLLIAGLSDEEALRWVDRVRQCGLEHRFTLQIPDEITGPGSPLAGGRLTSLHLPPMENVPLPP